MKWVVCKAFIYTHFILQFRGTIITGVIMKLNEYLKKEKLSIAKFAMKCDIPFPTISKYYYGEKIPRQENMHKIYKCTEQKVDANDFYGIG